MDNQRRNIIEEYEINSCTMVIMPCNYGRQIYSKIYETNDEYLSPFKPIDIIKKSCEFFGSSYEGRIDGTRKLIGISHKVPIAIDPSNFLYFFPTNSPSKSQCIWISHEHILKHNRCDHDSTTVTFTNKQSMTIPVSFSSFQNQLFRTAMLRTKLTQRIEERKSYYFNQNSRFMEVSEKH